MGKKSRNKGAAGEREVVNLLKAAGFEAQRTAPLQAAGGPRSGADVLLDNKDKIEVKRRKNGFKNLYAWLEEANYLFLRADRKGYIVCMDLEEFLKLKEVKKI